MAGIKPGTFAGILVLVALFLAAWLAGLPTALQPLSSPAPYYAAQRGSSGGAVGDSTAAQSVALPADVPPEAIDWSAHSTRSHPGVAQAIAAAIATQLCKPDVRICADGTVYLVCWNLHGSNGVVPLVPNGGRWMAKTAFWANQDYIRRLFDDEGCSIFGDLAILPLVDWEIDNE